MGKLITLSDFHSTRDRRVPIIDASWYFTDASWSSESDRYVFDWPSPDFPHALFIHDDNLSRGYDSDNKNKVRIRRWIELSIADTVITDRIDNSYRKYYGKDHDWNHSYNITNSWSRFSFEDSGSATMFALAFSDIIGIPTKWHPKHPEDEEYLKTLKSGY